MPEFSINPTVENISDNDAVRILIEQKNVDFHTIP